MNRRLFIIFNLSVFVFIQTVVFWAHAEDSTFSGADIMLKVDERDTGRRQVSISTLTLMDKKDRGRAKRLKMFRLNAEEVEKSVMFFLDPTDIKGTAYLTYDWKDKAKDDDSWLYLPALKKIKRVAAADESGSFMGSDFSYSDINGFEVDDYHYTILKNSEMIQGQDCWLIESIPKNKQVVKKTGYIRMKSWVRKDIFMVIQAIIELEKAKKMKYFATSNVVKIDGIWTAKTLQMITTRNNKKIHSSVFEINDTSYSQEVDEKLFDTQAMQRGL